MRRPSRGSLAEGASSGGPSPEGWLFVRSSAVPERWRDRAVDVALLPLLPGEVGTLLAGREVRPLLDREDERLLRLVAEGRSAAAIARDLGLHPRTVQRRLARLRRRLGVRTTRELSALLARTGFEGKEPR